MVAVVVVVSVMRVVAVVVAAGVAVAVFAVVMVLVLSIGISGRNGARQVCPKALVCPRSRFNYESLRRGSPSFNEGSEAE